MSVEAPGTILGGLPVIADVSFGKDPDTPNGPGDYWAEVEAIYWQKRDGSKGKEIPEHLRDRAETYDPYFANLVEQVNDHLAYEAWERGRTSTAPVDTLPEGGNGAAGSVRSKGSAVPAKQEGAQASADVTLTKEAKEIGV